MPMRHATETCRALPLLALPFGFLLPIIRPSNFSSRARLFFQSRGDNEKHTLQSDRLSSGPRNNVCY